MPPETSKSLPEANEFSPGQIPDVRELLKLVADNQGDRPTLVEAIRARYFADSAKKRTDPSEQLVQQRKRANNVLIGLKGYGLFDLKTNQFTEFGAHVVSIDDESQLLDELAKHILVNCHGLELLDAVSTGAGGEDQEGHAEDGVGSAGVPVTDSNDLSHQVARLARESRRNWCQERLDN